MPTPTREQRTAHSYWTVPTLSSWTVAGVRCALDEHERGNFELSAQLAEAMERNPRIYSAINTRVKGATGLPFAIEPNDKAPTARGKRVAEALMGAWYSIAPEKVVADLLRWAVLLGVAFAEVVWRTEGGAWLPSLRVVHPYWVQFNEAANGFEVHTREGLVPITPGDGWLVFGYASERPWMRGVVRCLSLEDTVRGLAVRDWARWSEVHGLPIRKAVVPQRATEDEKDRFFDDVSALGSETTVLAPTAEGDGNSFDLALVEAKDTGWEGFARLIEFTASDVSIAVLGQNLSTEVTRGSLAAAKVHDRVRQDYLEDDAETLSSALHEQVLEPWARFNYGDVRLAPWPCWDASTPEDRAALATTWQTAGNAAQAWNTALASQGKAVDLVALAERWDVPLRDVTPAEAAPHSPPAKPQTDGTQ